jgi:hypothetical protein
MHDPGFHRVQQEEEDISENIMRDDIFLGPE